MECLWLNSFFGFVTDTWSLCSGATNLILFLKVTPRDTNWGNIIRSSTDVGFFVGGDTISVMHTCLNIIDAWYLRYLIVRPQFEPYCCLTLLTSFVLALGLPLLHYWGGWSWISDIVAWRILLQVNVERKLVWANFNPQWFATQCSLYNNKEHSHLSRPNLFELV